jgi:hypothetical protein
VERENAGHNEIFVLRAKAAFEFKAGTGQGVDFILLRGSSICDLISKVLERTIHSVD